MDSRRVLDQMTAYPLRQSVAFWHIGDHLGRHTRDQGARAKSWRDFAKRSRPSGSLDDDDSHLVTATVEGELPSFARAPSGLDIIGIQASALGQCSESYSRAMHTLLSASC